MGRQRCRRASGAWANHKMLPALTNQMIAMGFLHNFAFNSEEKATIAEWKVWDRSSVTEAAMSEYVKRYARNVPGTFDPAKDACPGLDKRGVMADRGLLFLNVDSNHTGIDVSFRVNEAILKAPRKVRLTVRDYAGNSTSVSTVIKEPRLHALFPCHGRLPDGQYIDSRKSAGNLTMSPSMDRIHVATRRCCGYPLTSRESYPQS